MSIRVDPQPSFDPYQAFLYLVHLDTWAGVSDGWWLTFRLEQMHTAWLFVASHLIGIHLFPQCMNLGITWGNFKRFSRIQHSLEWDKNRSRHVSWVWKISWHYSNQDRTAPEYLQIEVQVMAVLTWRILSETWNLYIIGVQGSPGAFSV